ncbi:hypothetical protein [Cohnella sp. WQ 127256]|uniref:hypothetical protein n=1 Tax=Cohnella sp. WQ 127256 TaxID=2938790 RepID=UPI002118DA39|nr:hypothetical protein [Cohnella sp. WQ 127256]
MEDLRKAYEILGLDEDATREQVENRYFILMKRARSEKSRTVEGEDGNQPLDLTQINQAYNLVLGIETEKLVTTEKQTKAGHFFYYYKFHVIIGIIIVLIAGYLIKEGIDKRREAANTPPADLSVSIFGNFYFADEKILEQNMLKLFPDWQRIETMLVFVPTEITSPQDMAMQQKSVLMLMTEKSNLYITDEKNFKSLAAQGAFIKLNAPDSLAAKLTIPIPENKIRTAQYEEDSVPEPYGIDITGNPIFNGIELSGERTILAIRTSDKHQDNTVKILEKLIQTTP